MVRQIQCIVPNERGADVSRHLSDAPHVHNLAVFKGETNTMLSFNCTDMKSGKVLAELHSLGVGHSFGYTNTIPLQSCVPHIVDYKRARSHQNLESKSNKIVNELAERLPIEEIQTVIDAQNTLTVDYVIMCAVAAVIAGIGLLTDNVIVLVASMLLSPLMGPILGITFGTIVHDTPQVWRGIKNELVGVGVSFVVGALTAATIAGTSLTAFPTEEMDHRGNIGGLIAGLAIAIPSGAGVALAVTAGTVNPLVGVAISASVLPPCVNIGLCLVLGFATSGEQANELFRISGVSFLLWLINCIAIYVVALLMFRVKQVSAKPVDGAMWKLQHSETAEHMASSSVPAMGIMLGHARVDSVESLGGDYAVRTSSAVQSPASADKSARAGTQSGVNADSSSQTSSTDSVPADDVAIHVNTSDDTARASDNN